MKRALTVLLTALVLTMPACRDETASLDEPTTAISAPSEPVTQAGLSPAELGKLGAKIRDRPHEAQSILAEKGLTEQEFEQLVRRVTEDPEASKQYTAAYEGTN